MNDNKVELKPCPFCGGECEVNTSMGEYWVRCMECVYMDMASTRDMAIKRWNNRTNSTGSKDGENA